MIDWDTLRLVLAVHRARGLGGAARKLQVSLPTVSRRLSRAEEQLQCVLFDRRQGRLTATEAGLVVVTEAERMEGQVRRIQDNLRSLDGEMAGPINLSVPQSILPYCIADEILSFRQLYPETEINVLVSDALLDFDAGNVDIVIRAEENPRPSLWGRRVARLDFGLYAHRRLIDAFADAEGDLFGAQDVPLIVHNGATSSSQALLREHFPSGRVAARCNSLEAGTALIASGMGVGRLPCLIGRQVPGLEMIPLEAELPSRSLWVLTHKDLRSVQRFAVFIDFVAEALASRSELFELPSEAERNSEEGAPARPLRIQR